MPYNMVTIIQLAIVFKCSMYTFQNIYNHIHKYT